MPRVLTIDDEPGIVGVLSDCLHALHYEVQGTSDPREAVALFQSFAPDVCLTDLNMPGINGAELLERFKALDATAEVIVLTAETDTRLAIDLLKKGAIDYLIKPFNLHQLRAAVSRAIEHQELIRENRIYRAHLESLVSEKTAALNEALRDMEDLHGATLNALGQAMDFRDQSTSGHCQRVAEITAGIARDIGVPASNLRHIQQGAFLHDIGKLKIPDSILLKPAALTADEWTFMRRHAEFGREFLSDIRFLQPAAEIVYTHHERFDGTGYPDGLKGEDIPIGARIFAVVDAIDAMCFKRPYHSPVSFQAAAVEIRRCAGTQFDLAMVEPALTHIRERFLMTQKAG